MQPFPAPRGPKKVKPFGQGVDGIVGQVDKNDHGAFGKPPLPRGPKKFKPGF